MLAQEGMNQAFAEAFTQTYSQGFFASAGCFPTDVPAGRHVHFSHLASGITALVLITLKKVKGEKSSHICVS